MMITLVRIMRSVLPIVWESLMGKDKFKDAINQRKTKFAIFAWCVISPVIIYLEAAKVVSISKQVVELNQKNKIVLERCVDNAKDCYKYVIAAANLSPSQIDEIITKQLEKGKIEEKRLKDKELPPEVSFEEPVEDTPTVPPQSSKKAAVKSKPIPKPTATPTPKKPSKPQPKAPVKKRQPAPKKDNSNANWTPVTDAYKKLKEDKRE